MASVRAERQLILLSAGIAALRAANRSHADELTRQVNWERLAEDLRLRRLLGVLGPRMLELAGDRATEDFATAVEQELDQGRRWGAYLQLVSQRLVAMLSDAGMRATALKGPQLSESLYGDPGRRISSDIDLLVAADRLWEAVEVARTLGYAAPKDHLEARRLPLLHLTLAHERGELPSVELHWRVHWYEDRFAGERLLAPPGAPHDWRPAPADELGALLLFYARDGFVDLRLASDVSAWWDARGDELEDDALRELQASYPALARTLRASSMAAAHVVGLPVSRLLGDPPGARVREHMAARLANPNPHGSRPQLYADAGLIDGLLAPPGGLGAFVRRQLLPPKQVLDEQARHGQRRRARSPVARCVGMLGRYALTLMRLARSPEALT